MIIVRLCVSVIDVISLDLFRVIKLDGCQVLTGNLLFTSPANQRLSIRHSARPDSSTRLLAAASNDRLTNGNIQI